MQININHKIQQFFGGNWGKPNKTEQKNTKISNYFFDDRPVKGKKKRKKKKNTWIDESSICPFCKNTLEQIGNEDDIYCWRVKYSNYCEKCDSYEHSDCPSCHCKTW